MPLMVAIDLLLYKVSLWSRQMFYINYLSFYQTDLMLRSSSRHFHQDQSILLSIAFFTFSASIECNLIVWISSSISGSNTSGSTTLPCGCFCFIWYKVWSFNRRTPFYMLFAKSFIALLTLPFFISRVIFWDISSMVDGWCIRYS